MTSRPAPAPAWIEAQAEVTACKYQFARMNTLTMGLPLDRNQFLISFSYRAHGKTYSGDYTSPAYVATGTIFQLTYDPLAPQQNSKSLSSSRGRSPLIGLAIAASIVLSLLYLTLLRGCS
ncbi:MAG: hypothetical protein M3Y50_09630 [Acidobacteriota bacterium]|nr:hypothetical protein [Acidobacteriota bacterium]